MGFMDKAKKMAEQAQAKLDEAQKQFNTGQQEQSGPAVEYDQHGRPIAQAPPEDTAPPHGDPVAGSQAPPPPPRVPTPGVPPTGHGDPLEAPPDAPPPVAQPGVPPTTDEPQAPPVAQPGVPPQRQGGGDDEDRNHPSHEPPKLSSGDPLAG